MLVIQYIRINIDYLYKKIKKEDSHMAYHRNPQYEKFSENIRRQAVKRVSDGESIRTVSNDIGCQTETIKKWMSKYGADGDDLRKLCL